MALEVNFVTLGEAASRLDVPQPTLRGWADKLEEIGVHYLDRNERRERMFTEVDIEIFAFMKKTKDEYGSRRASTTDMAYVISDHFGDRCRRKNTDLEPMFRRPNLTDVDIQNLMLNERFVGIMKQFVTDANAESEERIAKEVQRRVSEQLQQIEERVLEQGYKTHELLEARMNQMNDWVAETRELHKQQNEKKGFFQRMFGG